MIDQTLYFAYGSNLNRRHWCDWCQRNGFDADVLHLLEPAELPQMELAFTRWSRVWGGGVLDLRECTGSSVAGMLYQVGPSGWQALDVKEGAPIGYMRSDHVAVTRAGAEVSVVAYRVAKPVPFVDPDPRYLEIVLEGLKECNLSTDPVKRAALGGPGGRS